MKCVFFPARCIPTARRKTAEIIFYRHSGVSQTAYSVVIARRNDEAIQLFSGVSELLHFVRNDESGLLRHPQSEIF
jgi:hypothetical protein